MNDAEYLFRQTAKERKVLGYGDKHKKRGGGRYVRLPSDNMSRKELNAMNGKCVTFNLNAPAKWADLHKWPDDIQRKYFEAIDEKYHPTAKMYAEMFGVSERSVYNKRYWLNSPLGQKGSSKPDKKKWAEFLSGTSAKVENNPVNGELRELEADAPEEKIIVEEKKQTPYAHHPTRGEENIAALIRALAGTGAKLTIEVRL